MDERPLCKCHNEPMRRHVRRYRRKMDNRPLVEKVYWYCARKYRSSYVPHPREIVLVACQDCGAEIEWQGRGVKRKRCDDCKHEYRRQRDNARRRRVRKARRVSDPEWAAADRARCAARYDARMARLREPVWDKSAGECYLCLTPIDPEEDWQVDHVHPKIRGGSDDLSNLAATHAWCNLAKGDKLLGRGDLSSARAASRARAGVR